MIKTPNFTAFRGSIYGGELDFAISYRDNYSTYGSSFIIATPDDVLMGDRAVPQRRFTTQGDVDEFCRMLHRAWLDHEALKVAKTIGQEQTSAAIVERFNSKERLDNPAPRRHVAAVT
jgi:hypothetical protein